MIEKKQDPAFMSTTVLAYLGDAIYEVYVRQRVIKTGQVHADRLHQSAIKYVKADGQAKIIKTIFNELPEELQALVKRARNKKTTSKPKNADLILYKWATAYEALVGYLYLQGRTDELDALLERSAALIEGTQEEIKNGAASIK